MNRPPPQRGGFSDAIRHRGNGTEAIPYNRKKSPTLRWGISHKNCSSLYAERKLATSRAVLLDGFKQNLSGTSLPAGAPCKNPPIPENRGISLSFDDLSSQTNRVLLVSRQAEARTVCQRRLAAYSWGPAATRALPSSLPVYFSKFLMKRADRSLAFSSQMEASA